MNRDINIFLIFFEISLLILSITQNMSKYVRIMNIYPNNLENIQNLDDYALPSVISIALQ